MKTPQYPRTRPHGFSLTELLFVMLIMIALAGLIAGSIGPVKNRVARYQANGQLAMIQTGLADYRAEYGGYPICENLSDSGSILYRTMFGDFNENGVPDWRPKPDGGEDDGEIKTFINKLQPRPEVLDGNPATLPSGGTTYVLDLGGVLTVVDPWDMPLGYINFRKGSKEVPIGGGVHNPTYDLWSYGNDPTLANQAVWLTNW